MEEMSDRLHGILELHGLETFRVTRAIPGLLLELLENALECYDRFIKQVIQEDGLEISCHRGCSSCCRFELPSGVMAVEALSIYHFVRPMKEMEEFYTKARENAEVFQDLLDREICKDPGPLRRDDPRVTKAHIRYNGLGRPCPFLDTKANECRIYPVRPMACRFYFSVSPWKWCHPDHDAYLHRKTMGIEPCKEVKAEFRDISRRLGLRVAANLPGAFVEITANIMEGRPLRLV